ARGPRTREGPPPVTLPGGFRGRSLKISCSTTQIGGKKMSSIPFRPRRSALYLPASNQRAIEKSRSLAADAVIFDLEDAVAPDLRAARAAHLVTAFGHSAASGRSIRVIRVNAMDSPFLDDDLDTVAT